MFNRRFIKLLSTVICLLIIGLTFVKFKDHEVVNTRVQDVKELLNSASNGIENMIPNYNEGYRNYEPMKVPDIAPDGKVKAVFVVLVRNNELDDVLSSIRSVQDRFNRNYHYPWVFFNDEEFTESFKESINNVLFGEEVKFATIPKEHWSYPEWISEEKAAQTREDMKDIIYGDSESYRHMCRYNSGFFYRQEILKDYEYYWRVEPDIKLRCDVDFDPFLYMKTNKKVYGFTISIYEFEKTIPTLWEATKEFTKKYPKFVHPNNMLDFISEDDGETYNLCHFWSNFEIASLDFWRGEAYSKYFEWLDHKGGFFYERWGDAPVHSIAAALFLSRDQIHYFNDIGYTHSPYTNCPMEKSVWESKHCDCSRTDDFTFQGYSCGNHFYNIMGMTKPEGWNTIR